MTEEESTDTTTEFLELSNTSIVNLIFNKCCNFNKHYCILLLAYLC